MSRTLLFAGVAALALAMPAAAEKGGKGGGQGNGGGKPAAHAQGHGGGHGKGAAKSRTGRSDDRGGGGKVRLARSDHHGAEGRGRGRDRGVERRQVRREIVRQDRVAPVRGRDRDRIDDRRFLDRRDREVVRLDDDGRRFAGAGRGCPPGLAKKNNGCLPPGQAKKLFGVGDRIQPAWFSGVALPAAYRDFYYDTPSYQYRYDDSGYIYRVDSRSNMISGLIPLLGGGFAVGQPLPAGYDIYNVPIQYRDVYYDSDEAYYRYGDNAIYQVDPESGMIESIVALLAGDLSVGEQLPMGYDAYNVPLDYRDTYYDNDDHLYRYADGNIYQVDAKTQIIQAIVEMLV